MCWALVTLMCVKGPRTLFEFADDRPQLDDFRPSPKKDENPIACRAVVTDISGRIAIHPVVLLTADQRLSHAFLREVPPNVTDLSTSVHTEWEAGTKAQTNPRASSFVNTCIQLMKP